jgi:hypothetical protein
VTSKLESHKIEHIQSYLNGHFDNSDFDLYQDILRVRDSGIHHGGLSGLTDNDHLQYFNEATSPIVASGQNVTFNWGAANHHDLIGRGDDDHIQYILVNGDRAFTDTVGGVYPVADSDLVTKYYVDNFFAQLKIDHGSLDGLTPDDDHPQYLLLAGRAGGQTIVGGTAASNNLTLQSTSSGTRGKILFGNSAYDEVNNRLGVNTVNPNAPLDVQNWAQIKNLNIGDSADSTENRCLYIGSGRTGNGYSYLNFVSDTTYFDYGFQILRNNSGKDTSTLLNHRGTGDFYIRAVEAANIVFNTTDTTRLQITAGGLVGINTVPDTAILHVKNSVWPVFRSERTTTSTNTLQSSGMFRATTTNNMADDFGSGFNFSIEDDTTSGTIAAIGAQRSGADNSGRLVFQTSSIGSSTTKMTIMPSGVVGIGTEAPNANALLDITSTTMAFMPPRMTTAQRDLIASPTEGMVVYNTTTHVLNFRNASAWAAV